MTDPVRSIAVDTVRISERTCWIFVTITSESGLAGIGEASLQGREDDVVAAIRVRGRTLVGSPADPESQAVTPPMTIVEAAASSAIQQALWDLAARRGGTGMAGLLGGVRRDKVPLYANINRRTRDRSPEGFAASARDALAAGYTAFKIAPFDEVTPDAHRQGTVLPGMAQGLARAFAVKEAVGPGHDVMIDCHWRFDEPTSAILIRRAAELGLVWVECPIPETLDNIPAIRRLRSLANERAIRLAGCEELVGLASFRPFIEAEAYDVLMPDVKYCGGPWDMLRIGDAMRRRGIAFSPHNPSGPICHAASLQVCAAAETLDRLEVQFDEGPLFTRLVRETIPPCVEGASALPSGPGIGMTLDPRAVASCRVGGYSREAD
jgi:galactonate dehydratase